MEALPKIRLACWRGTPVYLDVTFVLVPLVLFPWRLFLDVANVGWSDPHHARRLVLWAIAVAGTFSSILIHELGHALVARSYRVDTRAIQIGGFYGFALMPVSPQFRRGAIPILAAGPLMNLLIAVGIWIVLGLPEIGGRLDLRYEHATASGWGYAKPLWVAGLEWLFQLNCAMAMFNILPAFPLDGGRMVRTGLRRSLGERRAVRLVSACGCVVGAWSMLGSIALGAVLLPVGFLLAFYNWSVWRDEIEAPED